MISSIGPIVSDSCSIGGGLSVEEPLLGTVFCCVDFFIGVNVELPGKSVDAFAGRGDADIVVVEWEVESLNLGP